jgi:hypothetical protein
MRMNVKEEQKIKIDFDLWNVLQIQSSSGEEGKMIEYVVRKLLSYDDKTITFTLDYVGNVLVTKGLLDKGEYYPCVVSHLDTVHAITQHYKVKAKKDKDKVILTSDTGVGGDDKCGVYITLKMIKELDVVKAVFFVGEEAGGIGNSAVDMRFFDDVGYVLEPDRKGNNELLFGTYGETYASDEYKEKVLAVGKELGYKEGTGTYTDVFGLKTRHLDVSITNIACGYYKPHTEKEFIVLDDLNRALEVTKRLIKVLGRDKYEHKYVPVFTGYGWRDRNKVTPMKEEPFTPSGWTWEKDEYYYDDDWDFTEHPDGSVETEIYAGELGWVNVHISKDLDVEKIEWICDDGTYEEIDLKVLTAEDWEDIYEELYTKHGFYKEEWEDKEVTICE